MGGNETWTYIVGLLWDKLIFTLTKYQLNC